MASQGINSLDEAQALRKALTINSDGEPALDTVIVGAAGSSATSRLSYQQILRSILDQNGKIRIVTV